MLMRQWSNQRRLQVSMSMQLNKMTESTRQLSSHLTSLHPSVYQSVKISRSRSCLVHAPPTNSIALWSVTSEVTNSDPSPRWSTSHQKQHTSGKKKRDTQGRNNGAETGRVLHGTSQMLLKIQLVQQWSAFFYNKTEPKCKKQLSKQKTQSIQPTTANATDNATDPKPIRDPPTQRQTCSPTCYPLFPPPSFDARRPLRPLPLLLAAVICRALPPLHAPFRSQPPCHLRRRTVRFLVIRGTTFDESRHTCFVVFVVFHITECNSHMSVDMALRQTQCTKSPRTDPQRRHNKANRLLTSPPLKRGCAHREPARRKTTTQISLELRSHRQLLHCDMHLLGTRGCVWKNVQKQV